MQNTTVCTELVLGGNGTKVHSPPRVGSACCDNLVMTDSRAGRNRSGSQERSQNDVIGGKWTRGRGAPLALRAHHGSRGWARSAGIFLDFQGVQNVVLLEMYLIIYRFSHNTQRELTAV